jgi:hypothetical protein
LEGHILVISKTLYGLRTSGARFHKRLADTLRAEGFSPSLAGPNVWMRDAGDVWEYICVYVDDLFAALCDPKAFADCLPIHGITSSREVTNQRITLVEISAVTLMVLWHTVLRLMRKE